MYVSRDVRHVPRLLVRLPPPPGRRVPLTGHSLRTGTTYVPTFPLTVLLRSSRPAPTRSLRTLKFLESEVGCPLLRGPSKSRRSLHLTERRLFPVRPTKYSCRTCPVDSSTPLVESPAAVTGPLFLDLILLRHLDPYSSTGFLAGVTRLRDTTGLLRTRGMSGRRSLCLPRDGGLQYQNPQTG